MEGEFIMNSIKLIVQKSGLHRNAGKSIGKKITLMSVCCICITVLAVAAIILGGSNMQEENILAQSTDTSISTLNKKIASLSSTAANTAVSLVGSSAVSAALSQPENINAQDILRLVSNGTNAKADFITVTDASGKILAGTSSSVKAGTSLPT